MLSNSHSEPEVPFIYTLSKDKKIDSQMKSNMNKLSGSVCARIEPRPCVTLESVMETSIVLGHISGYRGLHMLADMQLVVDIHKLALELLVIFYQLILNKLQKL